MLNNKHLAKPFVVRIVYLMNYSGIGIKRYDRYGLFFLPSFNPILFFAIDIIN